MNIGLWVFQPGSGEGWGSSLHIRRGEFSNVGANRVVLVLVALAA